MIKILLVEDEPGLLDVTAYVLRRERFVVVEATDGAQALRRWKAGISSNSSSFSANSES